MKLLEDTFDQIDPVPLFSFYFCIIIYNHEYCTKEIMASAFFLNALISFV